MLKNLKIPRLGRNRLGVFFVRFPSVVDDAGRRKVVQQSLRTKDPFAAKLRALQFCLDLATGVALSPNDPRDGVSPYNVNLDTGEFSAEGDEDHERMTAFMREHKDLFAAILKLRAEKAASGGQQAPITAAQSASPKLPSTSLEEAFKLHLAVEANSLKSDQTVGEKRALFRDFLEVFGTDLGIKEVTAEQFTKRWTPVENARENKKFGGTLSLSRLDKRRGYLAKFFDWAQGGGLYPGPNPARLRGARKKQIREQTKSYAEFTGDDLATIFSSDYPIHMDKPDWYWIPLLGLFSGARLGELCELTLADFREVENIKVFDVLDGKTAGSRRTVPVHSTLLDLGLWQYVESLRDRHATHLLHHRPVKYLQKSVGREFKIWLIKCGIKAQNSRKVFHSFRSTAITDMHNSEAGAAAIRRAVGHATAGTSGIHGTYIRGVLLAKLRDTIEKLSFPSVDFNEIKLVDPTFDKFFDSEDEWRDSGEYAARQQKRLNHEAARKKLLARRPLSA